MDADRDGLTRYLNRDGRWRDFSWFGLDLGDDGALRLAGLPSLAGALPPGLEDLPRPDRPAGIAVAPGGDVFLSDPERHVVLRIDGCDGSWHGVPCLGGEGDEPTRFREPRGLLVHPTRNALLVADSGNRRIQLFDLTTLQLIDVWGGFDLPVSLDGDGAGNVYVADQGSGRLVKLDATGREIDAFWETLAAELGGPIEPVAVALDPTDDGRVYLVDSGGRRLYVIAASGVIEASFPVAPATAPMGLAVRDGSVYLGDNSGRRVLRFRGDGEFVGEASGYAGPVAALGADRAGMIIVHPGAVGFLAKLQPESAYVPLGVLWGGPFANGSYRPEQRHRLRLLFDDLPTGTRVALHVFRRVPGDPDALPVPPVGNGPAPFADAGWGVVKIAPGATETLFNGEPEDEVWIGVELRSEGRATPVLTQMRLDFDHATPIEQLPAIYRKEPAPRDFLSRFLALFESPSDDADTAIDDLPLLFDPDAAPEPLLPWLASWLAEETDEGWTAARKRQAIATSFARSGWRGTAHGLRAALADDTGVAAVIEEPIGHATWWSLPGDDEPAATGVAQSMLGFTTGLVAVEPQGAVLGTTATLDASHLIASEEFGAPLFGDLAHRVVIRLYRGRSYSERTVETVHAIVEREIPAHVAFQICVVEPAMRIGFQTRIGIDSIVAAPTPPGILAGEATAGGLRLGGEPAGRVGQAGEIGRTTRLGG